MSRLVDHLALARKKIIKTRKNGLSFNLDRLPKITSLVEVEDWKKKTFNEFRRKVEQARVVIFAVLPGMDDPEHPDTLVIASIWGEVLVTRIRDLAKRADESRREMEGLQELQGFFNQVDTAYITEKEDRTVRQLQAVGISLDEATITGLETWHPLRQEFAPTVAYMFGELWGRITAPFKGSSSSGWAWNQHKCKESPELAPDQTRLAFAIGNSMASLTLDGVVARIDSEDPSPLKSLGLLVIQSEQEGILEADETIGMRALQLEAGDKQDDRLSLKVGRKVSWEHAWVAYREPFGHISKAGSEPIFFGEGRVLESKKEVLDDLVAWEEAISFITLLGPEHKGPLRADGGLLPEPPARGILKSTDLEKNRRANERLGLDPDDVDFAAQRFAGLCVTETSRRATRTRSPPLAKNEDIHGLWEEERHRQMGGRHRWPPTLRWNPPVRREPIGKRHRDPEAWVNAWSGAENEVDLKQGRAPPSKKVREERRERTNDNRDLSDAAEQVSELRGQRGRTPRGGSHGQWTARLSRGTGGSWARGWGNRWMRGGRSRGRHRD